MRKGTRSERTTRETDEARRAVARALERVATRLDTGTAPRTIPRIALRLERGAGEAAIARAVTEAMARHAGAARSFPEHHQSRGSNGAKGKEGPRS